jgi:hypothetical protein
VFEKEESFRAETADGTRVRIGGTANEPRGDSEFWQQALAFHLGPLYAQVRSLELGPFRAVLLASKDRRPFHYLVGVAGSADDRSLTVLEAFFPDDEALARRLEPLAGSLSEMEL